MTPAVSATASRASLAGKSLESTGDAGYVERETWTERLVAALPLFVVGALCVGVAVDLYYSGTTTDWAGVRSARFSPWVLFLALGVTGLAGGVLALLVEDERAATEPTPAVPPSSTSGSPAWDESSILPGKSGHFHPRTWEQYPEIPTEVGWTSVEPRVEAVPPDVVLIQIDEIAASLKRKTPPTPPPASDTPSDKS